MSDDDSILNEFIQEATEHLEGIEADLLAIEEGGENVDVDLVNKVFRAIHSIKGGAGFFGLNNIKDLAHYQENILNKIRSKELVPTPEIMNVLLSTIDTLGNLVEHWESSNDEDISEELSRLQSVDEDQTPQTTQAKESSCETPEGNYHSLRELGNYIYKVDWIPSEDVLEEPPFKDLMESILATGDVVESTVDIDEMLEWIYPDRDSYPKCCMIYASIVDPDIIDTVFPLPCDRVQLVPMVSEATPVQIEREEKADCTSSQSTEDIKAPPLENKKKAPSKNSDDGSLRVPLRTLNQLMTLAGELVLTRNQLMESLKSQDMRKIGAASQRVDVITSDLQMQIMSTRMQPIGKVFSRFQRVVRDLAKMLSKQIKVHIEGSDVELDKTIIESIADPLTHLVRNSVDHGVEMPQDRKSVGKPATGNVYLRAFHEAGHVIIEVADDGKGIDPERIKEKALREEHVDPQTLSLMSEKDIVKLIFKPGFSMAKEVTEVSGRGVGMDVVYTNFTKLGGVVDIDTKVGLGCTIRIKLPLTLAIIPSLICEVQREHFAVPQVNLVELVRVPAREVKERIQFVGGSYVLRFRNGLLPLLQLSEVLQMNSDVESKRKFRVNEQDQCVEIQEDLEELDQSKQNKGRRRKKAPSICIAVVSADNFRYGIIVDEFLDSEEIVVKPLGSFLKACRAYAGATIRGDGRVALILDILGISEAVNLPQTSEHDLNSESGTDHLEELQSFLVIRNRDREQFAVPFALITRIEKVQKHTLEKVTGRMSIRYQDRSLPLISLQQIPEVSELPEVDFYHVLIFQIQGVEFGLLAAEIVDILETTVAVDDRTFKQQGILGSFIFNDCTTLLIDLFDLTHQNYNDILKHSSPEEVSHNEGKRILIVDDSKFYRSQIGQFIKSEGYVVETAEDGEEAYELLTKPNTCYDLLLTDIEMPRLDGIALAKKVRNTPRLKDIPIIAITSLAGRDNEDKIMAAGVDRYLIKLARDEMMDAVGEYIGKND